jgi:phage terminase small subunit
MINAAIVNVPIILMMHGIAFPRLYHIPRAIPTTGCESVRSRSGRQEKHSGQKTSKFLRNCEILSDFARFCEMLRLSAKRRARDSNPQLASQQLISNQLPNRSDTLHRVLYCDKWSQLRQGINRLRDSSEWSEKAFFRRSKGLNSFRSSNRMTAEAPIPRLRSTRTERMVSRVAPRSAAFWLP